LKAIMRGLGVVAVGAGAAVGLAGPALADGLDGTYSGVVTNAAGSTVTQTYIFTSCGEGCLRLDVPGGTTRDLKQQGGVWTRTFDHGCSETFDPATLSGTYQCPMVGTFRIQLTKVA